MATNDRRTEDDGHDDDDAIDDDHDHVDNQLVAIMRRDGGGRRSKRVMRVNVTWNDGVGMEMNDQGMEDDRHDNDDANAELQ